MTILENNLLSVVFLVANLVSLAFLVWSYLSKKYFSGFLGLIAQISVAVFYSFLCGLKKDIFVFTNPHEFTANLIFLISVSSSFVNAVFGCKIYYQHRVISAIIIQLGIFFSSILLLTHFSGTLYQMYQQSKRPGKVELKTGFNQTKDFEKQKEIKKIVSDSTDR